MSLPMLAIPAITDDEDAVVKSPTNLVLVQMDPDVLRKLIKVVNDFRDEHDISLVSLRLESPDHEFVEAFDPEGGNAEELAAEVVELGYRLADLGTTADSVVAVKPANVGILRSYGFVKDCDMNLEEDVVEISIADDTIRFRGRYNGKRKVTCSSREVQLSDFFAALE